jgi:hypothetical protein
VALAGRSKSYAERLFQFPDAGALQPTDAADAVQEPVQEQGVRFTEAALQEIFVQTKGYPYFLQEWGYQSWNLAAQSPIGVQRSSDSAFTAPLFSDFMKRIMPAKP